MQQQKLIPYYDLIIVGGGLVGLFAAAIMSSLKLKILLLEKLQLNYATKDLSIALNASSQKIFAEFGFWHDLKALITPINKVHISHKGSFAKLYLTKNDNCNLGYIINANILKKHLISYLKTQNHIKIIENVPQANIVENNILTVAEKSYKYNLLAIADGYNSNLCQQIGLKAQYKTRQEYLLSNITTNKINTGIAYQRFSKNCVIAMLACNKNNYKTVITADNISYWQNCSEKDFIAKLQQEFGYFAGAIKTASLTKKYIINDYCITNYKDNILVLGNAAFSISPVTAQGLNISIQSIYACYQKMSILKQKKQNFTSIAKFYHDFMLKKYQQTSFFINNIHATLKSQQISHCKSLVLNFINYNVLAKSYLIQKLTNI